MGTHEAERTIEAVVRDSYGRLVSFLAARSRDLAAAEDALGDALGAALEAWREWGVPDKPAAGLAALDALAASATAYQPYWAVRAHLLAELRKADAADDAYARAIELSEDPDVRAFLLGRQAARRSSL